MGAADNLADSELNTGPCLPTSLTRIAARLLAKLLHHVHVQRHAVHAYENAFLRLVDRLNSLGAGSRRPPGYHTSDGPRPHPVVSGHPCSGTCHSLISRMGMWTFQYLYSSASVYTVESSFGFFRRSVPRFRLAASSPSNGFNCFRSTSAAAPTSSECNTLGSRVGDSRSRWHTASDVGQLVKVVNFVRERACRTHAMHAQGSTQGS